MSLSLRQQQYLQALGITAWLQRPDARTASADRSAAHAAVDHEPDAEAWVQLEHEVATCTRCALHETRTQAVFGVGNRQADWMIIGEAPGRDEDLQGEPFVGRAGKLLNAMLEAIGFKREEVYIANILKSRPPKNRDPRAEEVAACEPYLKRQIALIRPKLILCVGRIAAQNLLNTDTPIGKMRGRVLEYPDPRTPVVVTYHPAYLLRSPLEKKKAWEDLLLAWRVYEASLA